MKTKRYVIELVIEGEMSRKKAEMLALTLHKIASELDIDLLVAVSVLTEKQYLRANPLPPV